MNDLQKKSFELLRLVVEICEKSEIPYYLVCGTALGAVKYGGFIPWDDDIDVGLRREDYERFLQVAHQELPEWCFLQNYRTEKSFPHTFSKIRDSRTTFLEESINKLPMNHGIYVDIFPLDGQPDGSYQKIVFSMKQKLCNWIRFSVMDGDPSLKVRCRSKVIRILGLHKLCNCAVGILDRMYASYSLDTSNCWCNYGNWQGKLEYAPKWHYGEGTWATFEGLRVRIPENYDAYLTQKYGDWRKDPPIEKQKTHHISTIIDTERSYTFYLQNN